MTRQIFVNLPIEDVQRSREFFGSLGFEFNEQFSDENALSVVINEGAFYMLLKKEFFSSFITKQIADTASTVEVLNSFSVEAREDVDALLEKALAGGAVESRASQDYGFMYSRAFYDLDGHTWEVVWMDPNASPEDFAGVEVPSAE